MSGGQFTGGEKFPATPDPLSNATAYSAQIMLIREEFVSGQHDRTTEDGDIFYQ